jgi:hypothetical protein
MCSIMEHRIRINKIMSHTMSVRLDKRPATLDELTHLCVAALQIHYDGACPEECLEARARDFAAWHVARLSHDPQQASRNDGIPFDASALCQGAIDARE